MSKDTIAKDVRKGGWNVEIVFTIALAMAGLISSAVLAQAPAENKTCLCRECVTAFHRGQRSAGEAVFPGDFYLEDGLRVFTAAYHLRRGYCCGSGCRHCPYG